VVDVSSSAFSQAKRAPGLVVHRGEHPDAPRHGELRGTSPQSRAAPGGDSHHAGALHSCHASDGHGLLVMWWLDMT